MYKIVKDLGNNKVLAKCCGCGRDYVRDKKYINYIISHHLSSSCRHCGAKLCNMKHGQSTSNNGGPSLTYISWQCMKGRCYLKSNPQYAHYGARGIKVCDRWLGKDGFNNFYSDMGERPSHEYTIDRIDPSMNYEPSNCRWADKKTQARCAAKEMSYNGETHSMSEWSIMSFGDSKNYIVSQRIKRGMSLEDAISTPIKKTQRIVEFNGRKLNINQWSKITNIPSATIIYRLNHGWSANDALTKPIDTKKRNKKYLAVQPR